MIVSLSDNLTRVLLSTVRKTDTQIHIVVEKEKDRGCFYFLSSGY
jgi:hypothetical protein